MRPNHALALARWRRKKDFTTCDVRFNSPGSYTQYTYKVLKRDRVAIGDSVVVQWPDGRYMTGVVQQVHEEPNIKGTESYDFKWIVQKVDGVRHESLTAADALFDEVMKKDSEKRLVDLADRFIDAALKGAPRQRRRARGKK